MIFQCNTVLKNLDKEELKIDDKPLTLGKAIANMLVQSTEDKMKMYVLSLKFYNDETVTLDDADVEIVRKVVEKNTTYIPLVGGQILLYMTKGAE